jgi:hypothetical protein
VNVRVLSSRPLIYTDVLPDEDRPPHVRAGSAIAARGDELFVVQDDASFVAVVRGDSVTSIVLPRGPGGRRQFEGATKRDKLDLEACTFVGDELWAFGSGSLPIREVIVRISDRVIVEEAHDRYAGLRSAIGALNIEGVVFLDDEFWFFHRGNTGESGDRPAIAICDRDMRVKHVRVVDLGGLGFTDACAFGNRIWYLAAKEAVGNAIDDGALLGCAIGVLDGNQAQLDLGKAEGLAMRDANHAWITVDPDDPGQPTTLFDVRIDDV